MSFLSDLFSGNFSGLGQDLTSQVKQIGGSNTLEDLGIGAALVTGGLGLAGVGPACGARRSSWHDRCRRSGDRRIRRSGRRGWCRGRRDRFECSRRGRSGPRAGPWFIGCLVGYRNDGGRCWQSGNASWRDGHDNWRADLGAPGGDFGGEFCCTARRDLDVRHRPDGGKRRF